MGDIIAAAFWFVLGVMITLNFPEGLQEKAPQQSVHYLQKSDKTTDRLID